MRALIQWFGVALLIGTQIPENVEQSTQGNRPPAAIVESFDGLGAGFTGPQGMASLRNPSDNSLAVGPGHVVQTVNSRMAIFTKKGKPAATLFQPAAPAPAPLAPTPLAPPAPQAPLAPAAKGPY